jgi:hypothetical protein
MPRTSGTKTMPEPMAGQAGAQGLLPGNQVELPFQDPGEGAWTAWCL